MKESLFRAKRIDNGEWVEGLIEQENGNYFMLESHYEGDACKFGILGYEIDPATIGQYTRLKDNNNVKIFEGDVISVGKNDILKIVRLNKSGFSFCLVNIHELKFENFWEIEHIPPQSWWNKYNRDITVIGNIHDNPELLEEKCQE